MRRKKQYRVEDAGGAQFPAVNAFVRGYGMGCVPRRTSDDPGILIHINVVIVVNKPVMERLSENGKVIAARTAQSPATRQRSFLAVIADGRI